MEDGNIQLSDVAEVISNYFVVGDSGSLIPAGDFRKLEEFRSYLTQKLAHLMDYKYDTLINVLYRIDVDEEKLSELFGGDNREYIPEVLADLIIERSIQKVRFRQKYKNGKF